MIRQATTIRVQSNLPILIALAGIMFGSSVFDGSVSEIEAAESTPAPSTLRIDPPNIAVFANGWAQQLLVTQIEGSSEAVDATTSSRFESSNTKVATVSPNGLVRGVSPGQAVVRISNGNRSAQVTVTVHSSDTEPPIRFINDVVPVLTKLGCNSGGCHGKSTGQNGFKLSLLGFEPRQDFVALAKEARGRRIFPGDPARSLTLLKAIGRVPHGGGRRLQLDSDDFRVLHEWIKHGAAGPDEDDPTLERIEVLPSHRVLRPDSNQQFLVTAHFSNGETRDVTRQSLYQSNESKIADVDTAGGVTTNTRGGLFSVMVRFGGKIAVFHGTVPFHPQADADTETALAGVKKRVANSKIDGHLVAQWKRLGIQPSEVAADGEFLRRVSIDICGTLPTTDEVREYLADRRPDKRASLINRLLERPEYGSYFALKWADILQNRGRGYSTSKQRAGTALFAAWLRDSIDSNMPYDRFVSEILTATGSQQQNPPTLWYRSVRTTTDYVESIAQAFLGVRIQCAQCHHHPFERWSQADYYGLAAVFARVGRKGGFNDAEVPTNETIYVKKSGNIVHPRTGQAMHPRPLGGPDFELGPYADPRRNLARWMTDPKNPFFARTMVNRMWGHFLGRGIIHPIDDFRSTNPPSNPEFLNALTREFVSSGYDVKHLIRTICNSYAYRLSSTPSASNEEDIQSFARFYPRRLVAEVLLDGMSQVLDVPTSFSGGRGKFPKGTRAIDLPDENVPAHFLDVFGRPARTSACECERTDDPALAQALELVSSKEIQRKLSAKDGYVERLVSNKKPHTENVPDIFLRTFARPVRDQELKAAIRFLENDAADRRDGYASLLWALLASNEFLFNH